MLNITIFPPHTLNLSFLEHAVSGSSALDGFCETNASFNEPLVALIKDSAEIIVKWFIVHSELKMEGAIEL